MLRLLILLPALLPLFSQGNPYIYGSFNARDPNALVVSPYQLQSTPTPTWWMSNVLIGVLGVLDTDTLQVRGSVRRRLSFDSKQDLEFISHFGPRHTLTPWIMAAYR